MGIIIVDKDGQRLTKLHASGRFLAMFFLNAMIFYIGYLMVGFTNKKRGLHDMIASTYVIYKTET